MKVGALVHMYPPLHNAGAEHMLHGILAELVRRGAPCAVALEPYKGPDYELDGVHVGTRAVLADCDVLLTHLDRTPEAEAFAKAQGIPLAQIMHNHHRPGTAKNCQLAVYNSHWIAQGYPTRGCEYSIVVHPVVWPDRYRVTPGERVTLINLQAAKGVKLFYQLAAVMPDVEFLGVFGAYGAQEVPPALDNLVLLPQQRDIRVAYSQTRVLLMPSEYESYGRCALEAAVSGIPTIANTTPGLVEALGGAGVFPPGLDVEAWANVLWDVLGDWKQYSDRARDLVVALDPAGDVGRLECALSQAVERGVPQPKVKAAGLKYPIRLAHTCELGAKRYPAGSRVDRDVAVALKAAGQLKDERIV